MLSASAAGVDDVPWALLCCTQLPCTVPPNAALHELLHEFENRITQFGDSVWEALKFLAQV